MHRLVDALEWNRFPIPAGSASGMVDLAIGTVGSNPPVALITAGIHGDEGPWGAWAIRKMLEAVPFEALQGTIRVVPAANPLAMQADARNAPLDTLDLNRAFPGDSHGSYTERLAALLVTRAIEGANVVIDLHGGGSWCVNAFAFQFPGGTHLSRAFGAPFMVSGPDRDVTLTGYARTQGAAVAAIEMGGRSQLEESWAERIAQGLRRALGAAGILTPDATEPAESIPVGTTTVLRPTRGGIFVPHVRADSVGTIVPQGTHLGALHDPVTMQVIENFTAPFPQTALMLLRPTLAQVEGGAMTYVIAEPL